MTPNHSPLPQIFPSFEWKNALHGKFAIRRRNMAIQPKSTDHDYSSHLVKINPVTGEQTLVTTLSEYYPFYYSGLNFLPERNEITGIWNNTGLYRFNVSTKAGSTLTINTDDDIIYNGITHN